ncbi:hypothetical protein G8759_22090 [Spirosoma aureum]|uniref:DUF4386 domain-containing protein n=2 Tax=Spirosoma aureum TaxID=2692134 RepID=A0A6G9B009_9BACT|nr:hypothetical protein G8759_22090 [Spirosoma aureum]
MDHSIYRIGFWSGIAAFSSTVAFGFVQVLQVLKLIHYPWDEILIYGFSLCIVIPFLMEMLALHYAAPDMKKFWSHAALIFTCIYAVFVTANYVVQLATVIPMSLDGAANEIQVLRQTPHSLFWDFDAIGYICMGLATLFAMPVFEKQGFQRWVKRVFFVHGLVTPLITIVYFYPKFSNGMLLLALPWGITAPTSMLILALWFRQNFRIKNG